MNYLDVRTLHITCVAISITLFFGRGALQLAGYDWRRWRPLRILPHVVDTALLGSAVTLAWWSGQYPLAQGWLSAKVIALLLYVALGKIALGRKTPDERRLFAFIAALMCVAYIVGVAQTRSAALGLW